ncbi:MAG: M28 family peptidase [Bacteroidia bacterium]|nr:M28 family peptidase [Bacteroidia bacterium]
MKIKLFTVFLLYVISSYAQDFDYARNVVNRLASPEFKGRGYVDNGVKTATDFLTGEFRKLKLEPVVNGSYSLDFSYPVNTFPGKMSVSIGTHELKPGIDYLVEASCPSVKGNFGIIAVRPADIDSEEKLSSVIEKAGDNFILLDDTHSKDETRETAEKTSEVIRFLKNSTDIRLKGLILCQAGKLTWTVSGFQSPRPVIILNKLPELKAGDKIKINIKSKLIKDFKTCDLCGHIKGSERQDSMLLITAHYDHLGMMGKEACFPGANDNASGVAMLLNLAEYYSAHQPKYTIIFVAFSGEEAGLLGSKAFVKNPPFDLKKIIFLVNFDIAGTGDEGIRVVNGSIFKNKFDLLARINNDDKLLPKVDIRGAACISDHCPFYESGVPCLYIYTQGGIKAYHDVYDRAETLPLTEFTNYCKLMIRFFDSF